MRSRLAFILVVLIGVLIVGCSKSGSGGGGASATAHVLNGASPGSRQPVGTPPAPHDRPASNWQISPDKLRMTLTGIQFMVASGTSTNVTLTGCKATYDRSQPGLSKVLDCPFTLPAGTYVSASVTYDNSYDVFISDPTNGFFTDPGTTTLLSETRPAGGAQFVTVTEPAPFGGVGLFSPALVVKDGDTVAVSIVISALQKLQANVNGATAKFGVDTSGPPGAPSSVIAVGTPAVINYYVSNSLGTAFSYPAGPGNAGINAIEVLYSNAATPAFLTMSMNGQPTVGTCGPFGVLAYRSGPPPPNGGGGYVGLDGSNVLGWAGTSEAITDWTTYSSVMRMAQGTNIGDPTTFKCLTTTTDPAPPGGSFSSGAPVINSPTLSVPMMLVAK